MRAVIQRVNQASVRVDKEITGSIHNGLLVLLGIHADDIQKDISWMADKVLHLRIFDDEQGVMNKSLLDTGGEILVVSQFTLYGDCRKGRRPSWHGAARPEQAKALYLDFIKACTERGVSPQAGVFQADMEVSLINDGPVTMLLDSHKIF